jgi:site-specific recombinase XerD
MLPSSDAPTWSLPDLDRQFGDFLDYAATANNHSASTIHGYRSAYWNFRHFLSDRTTKE